MSDHTQQAITPTFTRDEQARKAFTSALRAHVLGPQQQQLREHYAEDIAPAFERTHNRLPESGEEVHREMKQDRSFRFYSSIRTCAQEMVFASVIPAVEREMDELSEQAKILSSDQQGVGGSLTLNPQMEIPRSVTELDVHLSPGSFHAEYRDDDVATGAIYDHAIHVFAFDQFGKELNDVGMTMANYVRLKFPHLNPQKILDCGCTVGHNTLPWATTFPDAEVHAIDVSASTLRYANARAQAKGIPVHFQQMNATELNFADESFDIVFSSMFLHELPLKDIKAYFREAYRVLKPGGLLLSMELPPNSAMDPYESFYMDWNGFYNNEPYYKPFRDQDYPELCAAGGFATSDFIEATLPRYTFVGEEAFKTAIDSPTVFDSLTGRMNSEGTRWYGFGAFKR